MRLRREQLDAISRALDEEAVAHMARHLWQDLRQQCLHQGFREEQEVRPFAGRGIAAARGYGLTSEDGVRQYLDCMVTLGPDFDKDPRHRWAQDILTDPQRNDDQKTEALAWRMLSAVKWEDGADG